MNFQSSQVENVFRDYELRRAEEAETMAELQPDEGMARRDEFLLSVGPETAWFLHSLIVAKRPAVILELGTSYGYSTLFLADAAKQVGGKVISMECAAEKQEFAHKMLVKAGLDDVVELALGDALELIPTVGELFDFILLDIWKELYAPCFTAVYPKLAGTGIIAADNMIFPVDWRDEVRTFRQLVANTPDLQTTLLPIGSGIELSCRWPASHEHL